MNTLLRHIMIFAGALALASCSTEEFPSNDDGQCNRFEFVVRPTSFASLDVSTVSTKALSNGELTAAEKAVNSLYFLVFDKDGNRIDGDGWSDLTGSTNTSRTLYQDKNLAPLTVCYLANVPADYASEIKHLDHLAQKPLPLTYAPYSETGYIGIPVIDGQHCFPMSGMVKQSADGSFPGVAESVDENGKKHFVVTVPLKRLCAKVVVSIKSAFDAGLLDILDMPELTLYSGTLLNLPSNVLLSDQTLTDSKWVTYPDTQDGVRYFESPINVDFEDITISSSLISEEVLTCYVPEYYLASTGSNSDQQLKPQMFDPSKRPVCLTITGLAHQSNFVDVPVKYHIYFGENATDNFNLLRNCQYNNNMTITGTGEAILGTDERVEATYHNLADPDNTGTDNPANCYIISKPGRYLIPTYIGNNVGGGTKAGTSLEQKAINGSSNNKISNIKLLEKDGKNYIQFDVNMYASDGTTFSPTDVAGGNKLLVLKDVNGVVWSWHLWLCEDGYRPDNDYHEYPTTNAIVMDRSLGAINRNGLGSSTLNINLTYWDDCLYYQWGRKDPMLSSGNTTSSGATYDKSKQNPRTFYTDWTASGAGWSSTKSVNDPCPPGYKVPSNSIWRTSGNTSTGLEDIITKLGVNGYPYSVSMSGALQNNIIYPFTGYLGTNGTLQGTQKVTTNFYDRVNDDMSLGSSVTMILYYDGYDFAESSEFWTTMGRFKYEKSGTEVTFTEIYLKLGSNWFPGNPNSNPRPAGLTVGGSKSLADQVKASSTYKNLGRFVKLAVDTALKVVKDENVMDLINTLTSSGYVEAPIGSVATPVQGIQVRCVSETSPVQ